MDRIAPVAKAVAAGLAALIGGLLLVVAEGEGFADVTLT